LRSFSIRIFSQKAHSYLVTLHNHATKALPPGTDVQDQRNINLIRDVVRLLMRR